ncbi:MAG: hypothetical protein IKK26_00760 [Clostridia bacterium]|nr:hypothetical protein [Clostridia bacterium]
MKITAKTKMIDISIGDEVIMMPESAVIHVVMYLHPLIYENSEVTLGAVVKTGRRYHTTVNPYRIINRPLSEYGEELENPVKGEYEEFIRDCKFLIKTYGFTIIKEHTSENSKKSEYVVVYGVEGEPCGTLIYEIRISDHPFDATFPEELKDEVVEYLNMHNVMNGEAAKSGIDFQVEKVTVGSVKNDSWDRALNRLAKLLNSKKNNIKRRLKVRDN